MYGRQYVWLWARTPYRGALRTHQLLSQVPMTHSHNTKYDRSLSPSSKSGCACGGRDLCRGCWYVPWKNLGCWMTLLCIMVPQRPHNQHYFSWIGRFLSILSENALGGSDPIYGWVHYKIGRWNTRDGCKRGNVGDLRAPVGWRSIVIIFNQISLQAFNVVNGLGGRRLRNFHEVGEGCLFIYWIVAIMDYILATCIF